MNLDSVPGLNLASGTFTVPLWVVGVVAALLVALIVIAVVRSGLNELGSLVFRAAIIVIAVFLGWTYINRSTERDRADERRALDQRAAELVGRAAAPGSAIACLEATNTETVEGACERAVFASPETVAAATAYISARLTLLADAHEYTARRDQGYEASIAGLRRTIGADRYGLVSQVLAMHQFVRDSKLTEEEFRTAINYIVALGKASNETHNEAVLIAGSLGISSLVCLLNNSDGQTETDASLLGPFWRMILVSDAG